MPRFLGDFSEYKTHHRWAVLFIFLAFLGLVTRLFQLQVVKGEHFANLAAISHVNWERIPAVRGEIRDREGEILAQTIEVADLMMVPHFVKDPVAETTRLVELQVLSREEASKLAESIEQYRAGRKRHHRLVAHRNLVGLRCPSDRSEMSFDQVRGVLVCPSCGGTYLHEVAVVQTHLHELPGFSLRTRLIRNYPTRQLTSHLIGSVNEVTSEEIEKSGGALRLGDLIGRSGIERGLDAILRGQPGDEAYVLSASGQRLIPADLPPPFSDLVTTLPTHGQGLRLSIDLALQAVAVDALKPFGSGAVVLMDVESGDVLVMASHPVPRANSDGQDQDPAYAPMMNKATTAFSPGSIFKIFTAMAGLNEALVAPETGIHCPGYFDYGGRRFKCHKHSGHGLMSLRAALAASCDVYFYQLALMLGLDNIAHYARDMFGIGERTGIDIPESAGHMPTEQWYRRHHESGLVPGFAINTSVGQGDVLATPIQLARAYAAFVNGGRLMKPRLVVARRDPATGRETTVEPEVQRVLDLPPDFVDLVMRGMHDAVNTEIGTAYQSRIQELPFSGKTGTAQAHQSRKGVSEEVAVWLQQDHAWFAGYAPAREPRVAIVVFVEHGGFGSLVAAPVARRVIDAYYRQHADDFSGLWQDRSETESLPIFE